MKRMHAENEFTKGLVMDFNPLVLPSKTLVNALNATLVTSNGNELSLQNDMGNGRVETAFLPQGYVPVGTCEFGGIIYIVSYNPLENKSQIGCFPSPERNISSFESTDPEQYIECSLFQELDEKLEPTGELKSMSLRYIIYSKGMNPGDKYLIYSEEKIRHVRSNESTESTKETESTGTNESTKSIDTVYTLDSTHLSDYDNTSHTHGDFPKLVKIHVISIEDSGKINYLDSSVKWYNLNGECYYINKLLTEKKTIDIDSYRESMFSAYSIYTAKTTGKLGLLVELESINGFACSWSVETSYEYPLVFWFNAKDDTIQGQVVAKIGDKEIIGEYESDGIYRFIGTSDIEGLSFEIWDVAEESTKLYPADGENTQLDSTEEETTEEESNQLENTQLDSKNEENNKIKLYYLYQKSKDPEYRFTIIDLSATQSPEVPVDPNLPNPPTPPGDDPNPPSLLPNCINYLWTKYDDLIGNESIDDSVKNALYIVSANDYEEANTYLDCLQLLDIKNIVTNGLYYDSGSGVEKGVLSTNRYYSSATFNVNQPHIITVDKNRNFTEIKKCLENINNAPFFCLFYNKDNWELPKIQVEYSLAGIPHNISTTLMSLGNGLYYVTSFMGKVESTNTTTFYDEKNLSNNFTVNNIDFLSFVVYSSTHSTGVPYSPNGVYLPKLKVNENIKDQNLYDDWTQLKLNVGDQICIYDEFTGKYYGPSINGESLSFKELYEYEEGDNKWTIDSEDDGKIFSFILNRANKILRVGNERKVSIVLFLKEGNSVTIDFSLNSDSNNHFIISKDDLRWPQNESTIEKFSIYSSGYGIQLNGAPLSSFNYTIEYLVGNYKSNFKKKIIKAPSNSINFTANSYLNADIYINASWQTNNPNINPKYLYLTESEFKDNEVGLVKYNKDGEYELDGCEIVNLPAEKDEWHPIITRTYKPEDPTAVNSEVDYYLINCSSLAPNLEDEPLDEDSENESTDTNLEDEPLDEDSEESTIQLCTYDEFKELYSYEAHLYSLLDTLADEPTTRVTRVNKGTKGIHIFEGSTKDAIAIPDDIINNYFGRAIRKKLGTVKIPFSTVFYSYLNNNTMTKLSVFLNLDNLIYKYSICPAMPYGKLRQYTSEGIIDFNKICNGAEKPVKLTKWKYYNEATVCTLTWGLEVYPLPNMGVSEVVLEFYDCFGFCGAIHSTGKDSYNGTFTEYLYLNNSAQSSTFNNIDANGVIGHHPGRSAFSLEEGKFYGYTKEELEDDKQMPVYKWAKYNGENWSIEHYNIVEDDCGTLIDNKLYLVKIVAKYTNINPFGDYSDDSSLWKTDYRWFWANNMFNEYYISENDFNNILSRLTLDFNPVYKSTASYTYRKEDNRVSTLKTPPENFTSTLSTIIQTVNDIPNSSTQGTYGNISLEINPFLSNEYNTFKINLDSLKYLNYTLYTEEEENKSTSVINYPLKPELVNSSTDTLDLNPETSTDAWIGEVSKEQYINLASWNIIEYNTTVGAKKKEITYLNELGELVTIEPKYQSSAKNFTKSFKIRFKAVHYSKYFILTEPYTEMQNLRSFVYTLDDLEYYNLFVSEVPEDNMPDSIKLYLNNKLETIILKNENDPTKVNIQKIPNILFKLALALTAADPGKRKGTNIYGRVIEIDGREWKHEMKISDRPPRDNQNYGELTVNYLAYNFKVLRKETWSNDGDHSKSILTYLTKCPSAFYDCNLFMPLIFFNYNDNDRDSFLPVRIGNDSKYTISVPRYMNISDADSEKGSPWGTTMFDNLLGGTLIGITKNKEVLIGSHFRTLQSKSNFASYKFSGHKYMYLWTNPSLLRNVIIGFIPYVFAYLTQCYYVTPEPYKVEGIYKEKQFIYLQDNYTEYKKNIIIETSNTDNEAGNDNNILAMKGVKYSWYLDLLKKYLDVDSAITIKSSNVNIQVDCVTKSCPIVMNINYILPELIRNEDYIHVESVYGDLLENNLFVKQGTLSEDVIYVYDKKLKLFINVRHAKSLNKVVDYPKMPENQDKPNYYLPNYTLDGEAFGIYPMNKYLEVLTGKLVMSQIPNQDGSGNITNIQTDDSGYEAIKEYKKGIYFFEDDHNIWLVTTDSDNGSNIALNINLLSYTGSTVGRPVPLLYLKQNSKGDSNDIIGIIS